MTATITLGRVAGVHIGLHWSVFGILALLAALGFVRWPEVVPGYSTVTYAVAAALGAVLFAASLLAHELGHAVLAQRRGIQVDGITLWLLGGVAKLRGEATSPGADFRIAAVGPLISAIVGVGFGVLGWLSAVLGVAPIVTVVLSFLALINLVLAVFNLIPAAPLDGGRILRSLLWAWRGDRHRAAIWSARGGKGFGFGLMALGLIWLLVTQGFDGFWWILIGLFIVMVASAEEHQAQIGASLAGVRVADVMTPNPDTVDARHTIAAFVEDIAMARKHSAFPLVDDAGTVRGLITLNRIKSVRPERRGATTLEDAACPPEEIPTARPDEALTDLLPKLYGCADGRALVYEHEALAGIVTSSDISHAVALRGLDAGRHGGADLTTVYRPDQR